MDRLGGLGASMPVTAGASTIAALSIGGVPPSNGFASKWLIIATSVLVGFHAPLFLVLGIAGLYAVGQTLNLMTLGALTSAVHAAFGASLSGQLGSFAVASALSCVAGYFVYRRLDRRRRVRRGRPAHQRGRGAGGGGVAPGRRWPGASRAGTARTVPVRCPGRSRCCRRRS